MSRCAWPTHTTAIPGAQALVPLRPLRGRGVSAAAVHTQSALAPMILDHGGADLFCVTENQPPLHADRACSFADAHATYTEGTTLDRRRGRTATRPRRVTAAHTAPLLTGFPRVAQGAHLIRTVRAGEGTHVQVPYVITRSRPRRTTAAPLLALIRGQWRSEARHWGRDGTCGDERSRLRWGHAPQGMATLRSRVITLIRRTKTTALAAQRRFFAYHLAQALTLLLSKTHSAR